MSQASYLGARMYFELSCSAWYLLKYKLCVHQLPWKLEGVKAFSYHTHALFSKRTGSGDKHRRPLESRTQPSEMIPKESLASSASQSCGHPVNVAHEHTFKLKHHLASCYAPILMSSALPSLPIIRFDSKEPVIYEVLLHPTFFWRR